MKFISHKMETMMVSNSMERKRNFMNSKAETMKMEIQTSNLMSMRKGTIKNKVSTRHA
jgi:hypothetical protein